MKKYLSVFGLFARGSVYKVLITTVLMAIAEFIVFYHKLKYAIRLSAEFSMEHLETIIDQSMINWIFPLCALIITLTLFITGSENNNAKTGYTIRRLSISEREVFFCQTIYNILTYIFLWAVQAVTVFGLCVLYTNSAPTDAVGNQTIFLAFYRNELLHSIIPISDMSIWIRNIFIAIGLGFAAAEFPYKQRRHKNSITAIALLLYIIVFFSSGIGNFINSFMLSFVSICITAESLYTVFIKDEEEIIENETK